MSRETTTTHSGDAFRDHIAALLRTQHDNVLTEINLTAKKADICFEIQIGLRRVKVAAECKKWNRALTRDHVVNIINEYAAAKNKGDLEQLWIICDLTPAPGARDYVESFAHCQLMTALECEQSIVDFRPMLTYLKSDFQNDRISKYFIQPSYYIAEDQRAELHPFISSWLSDVNAKPVAIWAGYGMGKTTYARFLAASLAESSLRDYAQRIPILLNLGDFTTAPDLQSLIFTQLANFYGVRNLSSAAFKILNQQNRFILLLDGFDEMKFAMAPHDFEHISSEIRKIAAVNPKLLLLGRPGSIETDEEEQRLTSSKLQIHSMVVRSDDAPDFTNLRLSFLSKDQYLSLIGNFLANSDAEAKPARKVDDVISEIAALNLGDILSRPVQAKMLAEVVADPDADITKVSRFTLYAMFIARVLQREQEKAARRLLSAQIRLHFMRLLAWWLWTDKKSRTFAASEVPMDIVKRFEVPGVSLEGLRRELLIGSVLEERNIGHFLSEKTAGIFYFPHTSFTEFLAADYIMSNDFLAHDVSKLPSALYGEVPTFLEEFPSKHPMLGVYKQIKHGRVAMTSKCIEVLLNNFDVRMYIELVKPSGAEPWDACLRYILLHAENSPKLAREFVVECLESQWPSTQFSGMICLIYQNIVVSPQEGASGLVAVVLHLFRQIGFYDLISASGRGSTFARSPAENHIAAVVSACVKIVSQGVSFDFVEFLKVSMAYIGMACNVPNIVDQMPTTYVIPANDLLYSAAFGEERRLLADLLNRHGPLNVLQHLGEKVRD